MKGKAQTLLAVAGLLGMAFDGEGPYPQHESSKRTEPNDFAKRSNEFKKLCRPRLVYRSRQPYVRPRASKTRMTI